MIRLLERRGGQQASSDSSSEDESVSLENATDVKIGADEDGVVLGDDVLEPGKEYKFPVSLTVDGKDTKITEELMDGYKFNYSKISSKGMSRFEIEEYKGQYYLYVEARDTVVTKPVDVKYNVKLVRKSNNLSVFRRKSSSSTATRKRTAITSAVSTRATSLRSTTTVRSSPIRSSTRSRRSTITKTSPCPAAAGSSRST
ncbi:MAG: hypothetical protein ACLSDO_00820 [Anaerotruncus colihominis]